MNEKSCYPKSIVKCRQPNQKCKQSTAKFKSLRSIIDDYKTKYLPKEEAEIACFTKLSSLNDAIRKATKKRHSHQNRIPKAALKEAERKLLHLRNLDRSSSFHELIELIDEAIRPIYKIGPLAVYDIAYRVGAYLNIFPDKVYLHAGTTEGAKALGLDTRKGTIYSNELPKPFQQLTPNQIEDCLCIYKDAILKLNKD